jgi:hypothetical protein
MNALILATASNPLVEGGWRRGFEGRRAIGDSNGERPGRAHLGLLSKDFVE